MKVKLSFLFLSFFAAASLLLNVKLLLSNNASKLQSYKVLEVIDGDTFKIQNGPEERRVRLMGINTPEVGKCGSNEATKKLTELVLNKNVTLTDQFNDPYGRIMANVFVNNEYINVEMLSSGLGRMDYYENPHKEELKAAYAKAREKKLGLFTGSCLSLNPPKSPNTQIPCVIKGNLDDNTQKKSYFLPTCKNYSQVMIDLSTVDQWFCTEEEAIRAGFAKSQTCNM